MSKTVRTARGELVDFDLIKIKDQLSKASQSIEVAKRQQFIDNKEASKQVKMPEPESLILVDDFDDDVAQTAAAKVEPPAPVIPKRTK